MPNDDYIKRSDALKAILGVSIYDTIEELEGARTIAENTWADGLWDAYKIIEEEVDAADVEPKQRWIPVTERLPLILPTAMCRYSGAGRSLKSWWGRRRGMIEREKVIRGLEAHANPKTCETCDGEDCPYYNRGGSFPQATCSSFLAADALALLREQEARVIKEGELYRFQRKDVWIEKILSNYQHIVYAATLEVVSGYCIFHGMEYDETIKDYNVECAYGWRCWTSRPTPEQMRDMPWEGENETM